MKLKVFHYNSSTLRARQAGGKLIFFCCCGPVALAGHSDQSGVINDLISFSMRPSYHKEGQGGREGGREGGSPTTLVCPASSQITGVHAVSRAVLSLTRDIGCNLKYKILGGKFWQELQYILRQDRSLLQMER